MKKEMVKWGTPEPFAEGKQSPWKILPVKPGTPVRGLILSEQIIGCKTHWTFGRTKPCVGIENGCEGCGQGAAVRWKGYLAVYLPASRTGWLLEVSQHAFDNNLELCCVTGLRGRDFSAYRKGPHKNSPLMIDLVPSLTHRDHVPPEPNVQDILARIWFGRESKKFRKETDDA